MSSAVPHAASRSTPTAETPAFTRELGERLARVALANLATDYPHRLQHLLASDADARLLPAHVKIELAYLRGAGRASFERPYGWGWLLKLQAELELLARERESARRWRDALAPLADEIAMRLLAFLPRLDYPVRAGTHGNTAFALILALDLRARDTAPRARSLRGRTGANVVRARSALPRRLRAGRRRLPVGRAGRGRADAAHIRR